MRFTNPPAQGSCELELAVNHLETMDEVADHKWKANFPESLQERWFLVPLGSVEFPVAGRYEVILLADGEWITRSVIDVTGENHE